jgi:hypothetical protein
LVYFKGKITIPTNLCSHVLTWYHENLLHPGANRMFHTILQHFTWPSLCTQVEEFVKHCNTCQHYKAQRKKYGHIPILDKQQVTNSRWVTSKLWKGNPSLWGDCISYSHKHCPLTLPPAHFAVDMLATSWNYAEHSSRFHGHHPNLGATSWWVTSKLRKGNPSLWGDWISYSHKHCSSTLTHGTQLQLTPSDHGSFCSCHTLWNQKSPQHFKHLQSLI